MQDLKISLITVTYNAADTIIDCIESVLSQNYSNIEFIVIDGGSTDQTLAILNNYKTHISVLVSEPDMGIYDAINKGIKFATGDIVGALNADDVFASDLVLSNLATLFNHLDESIIYGNLNYVNPQGKIIRKWKSGRYSDSSFNWGWMPPHPTFYCRRALFEKHGHYDLQYGTAADYELMVRFMHLNKIKPYYFDELMIHMKTGGISNRSFNNRMSAWVNDYRAMQINGVIIPQIAIFLKPMRKIFQYILR